MENNAIDSTNYPGLDMILWDEHARFINREKKAKKITASGCISP